MKTKALMIAIVLLVLIIGVIYYFKSADKKIDEDIPVNKLDAKELVEVAKPYVDKYWENRNYHVGKISMELDGNLEGKVEIWYKDETIDKHGVPNIITVNMDTKKKKITRIIKQERNSKIVPGKINISNWNIGSRDAIRIAKNLFKRDTNFEFTGAYILGTKPFFEGKETWNVSFYDEKNKKSYYAEVDVYTGEVYSSTTQ